MNKSHQIEPSLDQKNLSKTKVDYEWGLEGLRGLAAVSVGWAHIFGFRHSLDANYHPDGYWAYFQAAHAAVLVFFVLSGYVIGLTNTVRFSKDNAIKYVTRRIVRLVPIYLIAIGLSWLIRPSDSLEVIAGHIFFLQPWIVQSLQSNSILWSLGYEMVYYFMFLIIWYLRPDIYIVFGVSVTISLLGWANPDIMNLQPIASYASGWIFWLSGLCIAWKIKPQINQNQSVLLSPILSYLLLINSTNLLSPGVVLLNTLKFRNPAAGPVNLSDLAFLPICLLIICSITKRHFIKRFWLELISFTITFLNLVVLVTIGRITENIHWTIAGISFILSVCFLWFKTQNNLLKYISFLGTISYPFYVLHIPIMNFIHDKLLFPSTELYFWLKFILWFLLTVLISSVLEIFIQPKIKKLMSTLIK